MNADTFRRLSRIESEIASKTESETKMEFKITFFSADGHCELRTLVPGGLGPVEKEWVDEETAEQYRRNGYAEEQPPVWAGLGIDNSVNHYSEHGGLPSQPEPQNGENLDEKN